MKSPGRRLTESESTPRQRKPLCEPMEISEGHFSPSSLEFLSETFSAFTFDSPPSKEVNANGNSSFVSYSNATTQINGGIAFSTRGFYSSVSNEQHEEEEKNDLQQQHDLSLMSISLNELDEKNDSCSSSNSKNSHDRQNGITIWQCFKFVLFFILFTFIIVLSCSVWLEFYRSKCLFEINSNLPSKELESNFSSCVIGQEFASKEIVRAFESLSGCNYYLIWLVGPPGVGKTRSAQIIENVIGHNAVIHKLFSSLLPETSSKIAFEASKLYSKMDPCKRNIIILEEFDEKYSLALEFVNKFSAVFDENVSILNSCGVPTRVLVILVGSKFSNIVVDLYKNDSTKLSYNHLQSVLHSALSSEFYRDLKFTAIPFLPLTLKDLKMCINEELNLRFSHKMCDRSSNAVLQSKLKDFGFSLEDVYNYVINGTILYSNTSLISSIGCKRVHNQINYLLFSSSMIP